mmetsp:Transcript_141594/g.394695  ORF Transcript_141594/g.394695 Transcript_141594/m.394695 type:complete len:116 (-) Transcript_141594:2606-2953(-)
MRTTLFGAASHEAQQQCAHGLNSSSAPTRAYARGGRLLATAFSAGIEQARSMVRSNEATRRRSEGCTGGLYGSLSLASDLRESDLCEPERPETEADLGSKVEEAPLSRAFWRGGS